MEVNLRIVTLVNVEEKKYFLFFCATVKGGGVYIYIYIQIMVDTTDKALLTLPPINHYQTSESLSIMIHQHQSINQSLLMNIPSFKQ